MAQLYTPINSMRRVELPSIWETINSSDINLDFKNFMYNIPNEQVHEKPQVHSFQANTTENPPISYPEQPVYYQYSNIIPSQSYTNIPQNNLFLKKKRKETKRTMFSDQQKTILIEWLRDHSSDPYPKPEEKKQLMHKTGLSKNQINTWFTNNRIRLGLTASNSAKHAIKHQMKAPPIVVC